jgi:hypothetical protein
MIVTDTSFLPTIGLHDNVAIVPVESAMLFAEIKTRLATDTFEQVRGQTSALAELEAVEREHVDDLDLGGLAISVPGIVLALESSVREDRVVEWVTGERALIGVCVLGAYSVTRGARDAVSVVRSDAQDPFVETLDFVGRLYHALTATVRRRRNVVPDWTRYMRP